MGIKSRPKHGFDSICTLTSEMPDIAIWLSLGKNTKFVVFKVLNRALYPGNSQT